jgi:putative OPT family oligopeptide transporter
VSEAKEHKPFIPASTVVPELTAMPLLVGTVLGILFGAASLYLALKIGMTISASIPIAVMSISIFKWFSRAFGTRSATILENNITQTTGSAGESIAFGVAATMPALMLLGFEMDLMRVLTISVLGGLLGILMMIPLRRGLVVKEHGKLAFPEGTACAEVLIAGEKGGTTATTVFSGFGLGFLFKLLNGDGGLRLFKSVPERALGFFKGGSVALEAAPELLGVGYIIGPRIASIMCAGGVLAYLVLIPAIAIFGDGLSSPMFPATKLIRDMSPGEIRRSYVLYIGAGAVAAGGIISVARVLPTLASAFVAGFKMLKAGKSDADKVERTDRDLPMAVVVVGSLLLLGALMLLPSLNVSLPAAVLILVFGFLFVTVSSRLTGEIGSSSNPISGMTLSTLLLTCLIFLFLDWTTPADRVAALSIAAVVCIASSNGGTTAQDLKTGFLVGATPSRQQIGILVGAVCSALVIGGALKLFDGSKTVYAERAFAHVVDAQSFERRDTLHGPDAERDANEYNVVHFTAENAPKQGDGSYLVPPGRYLVDDQGAIRYLVDPGINGVIGQRDARPEQLAEAKAAGKRIVEWKDENGSTRHLVDPKLAGFELPDGPNAAMVADLRARVEASGGRLEEIHGGEVTKFDAPQARLMSLVIDGILTRKLPWGLVLLGVFIAVVMELCGISALPFAVGVYLPLSASSPIFIGGAVRWLVEKSMGKKSDAESDSSPAVLFSSGLIAGGAIAGMTLAILAGFSDEISSSLNLSEFAGAIADSDLVALGLFLALGAVVYGVGREKLFVGKR